jgi:hypothetical protein
MVRASLGRDAGAFNVHSEQTAVVATYPMYGIPVRELMEMEGWVPHQDLLAQGKLHEISAEDAQEGRVIFVSHQVCTWAGLGPATVPPMPTSPAPCLPATR